MKTILEVVAMLWRPMNRGQLHVKQQEEELWQAFLDEDID